MGAKKKERCICAEPTINQSLPVGFVGNVVCSKCGGLRAYPLSKPKKYKGNDQIEKYLFNIPKTPMTIEIASLIMLLRIEKALLLLIDDTAEVLYAKEENKKKSGKTTKNKGSKKT